MLPEELRESSRLAVGAGGGGGNPERDLSGSRTNLPGVLYSPSCFSASTRQCRFLALHSGAHLKGTLAPPAPVWMTELVGGGSRGSSWELGSGWVRRQGPSLPQALWSRRSDLVLFMVFEQQ